MGKPKRAGTPRHPPSPTVSRQPGPMDEFLSTPQHLRGARGADKMAPSSPSSSSVTGSVTDMPGTDALTQMSADLAAISANMLTRGDKTALVSELRSVIREEIAAVRRDLMALEQRVDELEEHRLHATHHQQAADLATTRELLTGLFVQLLGEDAPPEIPMERAHRALRGPRSDGQPRDMICCLTSFQQKDAIMRAARAQRSIAYMDSQQVCHISTYRTGSLKTRLLARPGPTQLRRTCWEDALHHHHGAEAAPTAQRNSYPRLYNRPPISGNWGHSLGRPEPLGGHQTTATSTQ
ncbi:Hypothetical predicted protein [Pelobates cultripes]|uniref:Uncharacterized protein n=1 Tax=Pelobates cultripes TaxID=61616 RepID=A0AAD1TKT7_PELCU|nr:Hypothetical predicted protein [Pelobates cultripes]